jgi:hypothetical protein
MLILNLSLLLGEVLGELNLLIDRNPLLNKKKLFHGNSSARSPISKLR